MMVIIHIYPKVDSYLCHTYIQVISHFKKHQMKEELKVVYQNYIPEEIISRFKDFRLDEHLNVEVISIKEEQKFYNASGLEIYDIIIFLNNHSSELIVNGIGSLGYDVLKSGVKYLWNRLKELQVKNVTSQKVTDKYKILSLVLKFKEKSVELKFEGEFDTERLVDKAFEFLKEESIDDLFKVPDYLQKNEKPRIKIVYNPETGNWEPENFGNYQREIQKYRDSISQKLNN